MAGLEPDDGVHDFRERLSDAGVNPLGAGVAVIGLLLVLGAFTSFDWFRDGPGFFAGAGESTRFGQLRSLLDQRAAEVAAGKVSRFIHVGTSKTYFDWLGWVLLLAAVVATGAAVSRFGRRHGFFKWFGAVVGVAGIAVSLLALQLVSTEGNAPANAAAPTYGDFIGHSGVGAWAALAGFALLAIAALLPHRD